MLLALPCSELGTLLRYECQKPVNGEVWKGRRMNALEKTKH